MDVKKLSDDELNKLLLAQYSPSVDVKKMTDDQLNAALLGNPIQGKLPDVKIENERTPAISALDRFAVKNFGNDVNTQVEYLKKKYPDLDIRNNEGEIIAKGPDEENFKYLDPPKLELEDIGDVVYDIGSGFVEGPLTAAGAAAGAAGGPAGLLGGASAASAGASALTESSRQAIGMALGINPEMSGSDIIIAGGMGALSPFLFGAGGSKKAVGKAAIERAQKTGEDLVKTYQKLTSANTGITSKTYDWLKTKLLPKIAEFTSGVPAKSYNILQEAPGIIKAVDEMGGDKFAERQLRGAWNKIENQRKQLSQAYETFVQNSGATIDLADFRQNLDDYILKIYEKRNGKLLDSDLEEIAEIKALKEKIFKRTEPTVRIVNGKPTLTMEPVDIGDIAQAGDVSSIRTALKEYTDFATQSKDATPASKRLKGFVESLNSHLSDKMDKAIPGSKELNKRYKTVLKDKEFLRNKFLDTKKNPQYDQFAFGEKGYPQLTNLGGKSPKKESLRRQVSGIDQRYGTNLGQTSDVLRATKDLAHPVTQPVSSEGVTATMRGLSTTALGGALGYMAGGKIGKETDLPFGSAKIGGYIGMALGALSGSPWAMKKAFQAIQKGEAINEKTLKKLPYKDQMLWNLIRKDDEKPTEQPTR